MCERTPAELLTFVEDHDATFFLAETEGSVVGTASARIQTYDSADAVPGAVGIIDHMVVDAKRRSQGIGSVLLTTARALAARARCRELCGLVWAANDRAVRFYEAEGFVPQLLRLAWSDQGAG